MREIGALGLVSSPGDWAKYRMKTNLGGFKRQRSVFQKLEAPIGVKP